MRGGKDGDRKIGAAADEVVLLVRAGACFALLPSSVRGPAAHSKPEHGPVPITGGVGSVFWPGLTVRHFSRWPNLVFRLSLTGLGYVYGLQPIKPNQENRAKKTVLITSFIFY